MADSLSFDHVGYAPGGRSILSDINLVVPEGEWLTIVGPSGSGKSTLLKLAATLLTPTSGQILFEGAPQTTLSKPIYRQRVSYCFQQPSLFGETVRDNLAFPFQIRNQDFDEDRALAALGEVALAADKLDAPITDLSGGEKQRVALVRNLLFLPKILLLDEVTAGLDTNTKSIVHRLIARHHEAGMTVMMVTHDETEIAAATALVTVRDGRLEAHHG